MVTLQEYKAKKAEQTALSDVDFRKVQLLERNPRSTENNTSLARYNPITKKPYFTEGVVVNPRYDITPLDMLSRQLNNESIEATSTINPIQYDTNRFAQPRQAEYKTIYLNQNNPSCAVSKIGLLKQEKFNSDFNNIFIYTKEYNEIIDYRKILQTTQDDSYLRLQLTLATMDAKDGKTSPYVVEDRRESMVELLEAYEKANLPIASIQTPEGLELALAAIEAQRPQEKFYLFLEDKSRFPNKIFYSFIEEKIIKELPRETKPYLDIFESNSRENDKFFRKLNPEEKKPNWSNPEKEKYTNWRN